ncbi:MAG TPA: hypothetical protein VMT35_16750, partial [Ignavibacteriaceae bacterium]|nr:hypothetical protein [Ignavibacteriaceae bacterium]
MKNLSPFLLFIAFILPTNIIYSQNNIKTWTETTAKDFSDNQLNSLIVANNSGGEVQLPHPFIKTLDDYINSGIHRFISKDSAGNFVKTWIQAGNVFVKKYAPDGAEKTKTIQVNVEPVDENYSSKVSMMKDGTFLVIWNVSYVWYGQVFVNDSIKSGTSFRINEIDNEHPAAVLADNKDHNFVLFYTQKIGSEYKLHVQKRDINGNKIGESVYLNPEDLTSLEISPAAVGDEKGFWIAWEGGNGNSSWDIDLYLRRFNYDGSPAGSAMIVNDYLEKWQGSVDLELDPDLRLFVVWVDERDSRPEQINGCLNIYGQLFNKNGEAIGKNLRLNDTLFLFNYEPDIEYLNEQMRISWRSWDEPNRRYLTYVNQWKFDPAFSGEMVSSVFDASPSGSSFKKIFWDELYCPASQIKFQIRTGKTLGELNNSVWHGPHDISDFYTNNAGQDINSIHNGDRFIQYKAFFTSPDGNTSILKSVSINYSSYDSIPPLPPANLTAAPSHSSVILNWHPNNELDFLGYKLYRGMQSNIYDWDVNIPKGTLNFIDTTVITNKKYFYMITALDSSHNESDYSNEVSSIPFGVNIYVSTTGTSGGDGSINRPFKTLQEGINVAYFGDTIKVLPGTYGETLNMKNGVSLIGADAEQCKINVPITASD